MNYKKISQLLIVASSLCIPSGLEKKCEDSIYLKQEETSYSMSQYWLMKKMQRNIAKRLITENTYNLEKNIYNKYTNS